MLSQETNGTYADHIRTYRAFVFAVRLILAVAAVILLLMAYFLL